MQDGVHGQAGMLALPAGASMRRDESTLPAVLVIAINWLPHCGLLPHSSRGRS